MNPRRTLFAITVSLILLSILNEFAGDQEWRSTAYLALAVLTLSLGHVVVAIEDSHRITVQLPEAPVVVPNVHVVGPEDKVVVTLSDAAEFDAAERLADELRKQVGDDGYLVIQSPNIHADVEPRNQED